MRDEQTTSQRRGGPSRLIDWTGERFVPWAPDVPVAYEHFHRYLWAADLCRGRRLLDLGSGEGFGSALLARSASAVRGVDVDARAVEHSRRAYTAPNLSFEVADARDLDGFAEGSFDAVVCFEVIEHMQDHEALLAAATRVLAPDGLMIVSTPDRRVYSERSGQHNPFHEHELTESEFRELLATRFSHVRLWGQSLVTGSRIEALDGGEQHAHTVFVERGEEGWAAAAAAGDPVYLLALASSSELPAAPAESWLADPGLALVRDGERRVAGLTEELHEVNTAFQDAIAAVRALEADVAEAQARLAEAQERLAVVDASVSWALIQKLGGGSEPSTAVGRALRRPLRWLGRLLLGRSSERVR